MEEKNVGNSPIIIDAPELAKVYVEAVSDEKVTWLVAFCPDLKACSRQYRIAMSIHGKPLSEITESDLQCLINDKVRVSQTLEFKQEAYGRGNDPTREMLRDISAIANAFGGDLLIGVEEDADGIAVNLLGVEDAAKEADRMVSSCLSNIAERLPGVSTHPIPLPRLSALCLCAHCVQSCRVIRIGTKSVMVGQLLLYVTLPRRAR